MMESGMTRREKALRKMRNNPKQVRFSDLAKLLEQYDFEIRKTGGSHQVFMHSSNGEQTMKTVEYYMNLPYTIELIKDPEGWFVRVKELEGCMSQGDTAEEAIEMIQEAMELWLEVSLEDGLPIPEPRSDEDYSGKFVVRVPRSLHRELVEEAAQQGTSLNQYINVALARFVGRLVPTSPAADEGSEWPGLKAAARRVLVAAGLDEETGELDERLFAGWADQCLGQVESALARGDVQNALQSLEVLARGLRAGQDKSSIIAGFCRAVLLLRQQVETTVGLKQGASHAEVPPLGVTQVIQRTRMAPARMAVHNGPAPYTASPLETEQRGEPPSDRPDTGQEDQREES
jgi:antitoxin HicB